MLAGAALVSLYGTFELLRQDRAFDEPDKTWVVVAILATTLPLALRRRFPLSAASAVIAAFIASRVWTSPDIPGLQAWEAYITVWATWLALYSAVVHGQPPRRATLVVGALAAAVLAEVVREIFFADRIFRDLPLNQAFLLAYNLALIVLPIALGLTVRSLLARQRELQREREENARRAVLEERVRIARELHDVVAHHVSLMVRPGRRRAAGLGASPSRPRTALSAIEATGTRGGRGAAPAARRPAARRQADRRSRPQPGLAELAELVERPGAPACASSWRSRASRGRCRRRSTLSAYRIVQEALTNAAQARRRDAGGCASATRATRSRSRSLDDGRRRAGGRRAAAGTGWSGCASGSRCSAASCGPGRRPGGGFAVRAGSRSTAARRDRPGGAGRRPGAGARRASG